MQQDIYTITFSGNGWILHLNDRELAGFTEHEDAVQAASVAARMSERRGRAVEIAFPDERDSA